MAVSVCLYVCVRLLSGGAASVGSPVLWPWAASHFYQPAGRRLYHAGLSVVGLHQSHTHTHTLRFSLDRLAKVSFGPIQGFSFPLCLPISLVSLHILIVWLPWLPCQRPFSVSLHWAGHPGLVILLITLLGFWSLCVCECVFLPLSVSVCLCWCRSVLSLWWCAYGVCHTYTPVIHLRQVCVRGRRLNRLPY